MEYRKFLFCSVKRFGFAKVCAAIFAVVACGKLSATETVVHELSLHMGTNALITVEEGEVLHIDKITGERGTITKIGSGTLNVKWLQNRNVSFDVKDGRLFFDRQMPRVCADAFFHVDASRADTLELEAQNGTNFVARWNDIRGNGIFATNCLAGPSWRTNPENRCAFISEVRLNGMPVIDFGSILYDGHDGYGATMIWSKTCTNAYEIYEVISDTPDVSEANRATSFISSSLDRAGNYRGEVGSQFGNIFHDNWSCYGWSHGCVYINGSEGYRTSAGTYGKQEIAGGFSLLGFVSCELYEDASKNRFITNYCARVNSFARDYDKAFGGQRLAEYIVFTNRLDSADRTALQDYLNAKWRGDATAQYLVSSLTVAPEAAVSFAPGVTVNVANVSDGADLTVENGSFEINALNNPDAYFHVDADASGTLALEAQNGTNFVNRWDDVLSNGVYATASTKTFEAWLPDPENRRPFVSDEKLNNRPIIDFGPLQVKSHTNEVGYGVGYGASMTWSERMPRGVQELFSVVRDTDDVKTLYKTGNVKVTEFGQAYLCDPSSMRGFRGKLRENNWPVIVHDNGYNDVIKQGLRYVDGVEKEWESSAGAGFHLVQLIPSGTSDYPIRPSHFAYSYTKTNSRNVLGGTKIAEYLVFDHLLSNEVRADIYAALRTKWFAQSRTVQTFGNLTLAKGAEMSLPWKDVAVTNNLAIAGSLKVESVSAASIRLTASGANLTGGMMIGDRATVTVDLLEDGSFASLVADRLTLAGGGVVVLANTVGGKPALGEIPILTGDEFSGSLNNWTCDATAFGTVSISLELKEDGLYAVVSPKGTVFLVR